MSLTAEKTTAIFMRLRAAAHLPKTRLNLLAARFDQGVIDFFHNRDTKTVGFDLETAQAAGFDERDAEGVIAHELGHGHQNRLMLANPIMGVLAAVKFYSISPDTFHYWWANSTFETQDPLLAGFVLLTGASGWVATPVC